MGWIGRKRKRNRFISYEEFKEIRAVQEEIGLFFFCALENIGMKKKGILGAFVLAGTLYGFGAWLECNRMVGSGSAAYGQGWDMDAIAACVVGGVSFTGGIGKISGVVVGVLIFTALTYSLTILGIDTNLQFVFEGIIILAAVTLDCLKYIRKK